MQSMFDWDVRAYVKVCSFCELGKYVPTYSQNCEDCPIGTYREYENAMQCTTCPAGTSTNFTGSKKFTDCVCANSTGVCCDRGFYYNTSNNACQFCPVQTFKNTVGPALGCTPCASYSVANSDRTRCRCAENLYHVGHCMPYGPQYPWGALQDNPWYKNQVSVNVNILKYGDNLVQNYQVFLKEFALTHEDRITCQDESQGGKHLIITAVGLKQYEYHEGHLISVIQEFSIDCHPIPYETCTEQDYYTLPEIQTFSVVLEPSKICLLKECIAPLVPNEDGKCVCDLGYGLDPVHDECRPCPPFSISTSLGLSRCSSCPTNTASTIDGKQCLCASGYFMNSTQSANDTCQSCAVGKYSKEAGSFECLQCPEGFVSDIIASSVCKECPLNTFASQNKTRCIQCDYGKFTNKTASTVCKVQCRLFLGAKRKQVPFLPSGYIL